MKLFSGIGLLCLVIGSPLCGSENLDRARQMVKSGESMAAKTSLAQAAQKNPKDITCLLEYAEFLDRYGDPGAAAAYEKALAALDTNADQTRRTYIYKQLIKLDLLAGD